MPNGVHSAQVFGVSWRSLEKAVLHEHLEFRRHLKLEIRHPNEGLKVVLPSLRVRRDDQPSVPTNRRF